MAQFVQYEVVEGVAEITMNRGPVNAIDMQLAREVVDAYQRARHDDAAGAVILKSALPTVFSAGVDLKVALEFDGQALRRLIEVFYYEMHEALYRMGKPVIAAVNGHARAAGVTWAVSCDMVIAAEEAGMGYPEIDVGLLPAMHLVHLPRQAGRHRAAQLLFTGDVVSAREMMALGVVNEVVPRDQVLERARTLARRLARKSPLAMRLLRDAFMRANDLDYRRAMESVVETMCLLKESEDSREALSAFVEKREPVFRGR
ncbi:enoyl-CoA hydratase/isomerase family protein [Bordetella bronchiseptica]|uniref:enoyl-CoA hydratase/isomerase family protein n=1 Tax=Bordetella bronchiseptica TaxID=518 RepID=UPI000461727F|nr:enoyl-CoA hydratase/isomerase family protein [Bordetella bronchiseptica]KDC21613.1 enoyl-CoA hydratase/isomerase family protein [Bordetella bronchiseptica F-1]KDC31452.1 enoyl-CoA hydratase/isomerase family protein [Bordetella bronchiseptica F2]